MYKGETLTRTIKGDIEQDRKSSNKHQDAVSRMELGRKNQGRSPDASSCNIRAAMGQMKQIERL